VPPVRGDEEESEAGAQMRCENCRYWDHGGAVKLYGGSADDLGVCRRRPPVPDFTREPMDFVLGKWPETYNDEWCGDYAGKEGGE